MDPVHTFTFISSPDEMNEGEPKILTGSFICPLSGKKINVLIEQHQRNCLTTTRSYLMGRVKDVTKKITLYDRWALQKNLLQRGEFKDPITKKLCKSITYYKTMDPGIDKLFEQIFRRKNFWDL